MRGGVFETLKSRRVVRRINHRSNVVKMRRDLLQNLSDIQIVGICGNHPKNVGGDRNRKIIKLGIKISKEFRQHLNFVSFNGHRKYYIGHIAVRWKSNVIKIQLVKTNFL